MSINIRIPHGFDSSGKWPDGFVTEEDVSPASYFILKYPLNPEVKGLVSICFDIMFEKIIFMALGQEGDVCEYDIDEFLDGNHGNFSEEIDYVQFESHALGLRSLPVFRTFLKKSYGEFDGLALVVIIDE